MCDAATSLLQSGAVQSTEVESQLTSDTQIADSRNEPWQSNLGDLYSAVYTAMPDAEYFEESRYVLRGRLETNGIRPADLFGGKVIVDAGCGAGKFTQAIASFGAKRVIGIDIGEENIAFAKEQAKKVPHGAKIDYRVGSVLNLPVEDASADFVWCNSVGHVTGDQRATVSELSRVLMPNGQLFYYVNGRFGLFEILLKMLVNVMAGVPTPLMRHFLQSLGIGAGRISWIIACIFAPYEFLPRAEVEQLLCENGFTDFRLLTRGIDIDYSEKIARGEPFADLKYGEGQLRYIARRV